MTAPLSPNPTVRSARSARPARSARRAGLVGLALVALVTAGCSDVLDGKTDAGDTTVPATVTTTSTTTSTSTTTTTAPTTTTTTAPTTTTTTIPVTEQEEPPGPLQSGSAGKRTLALQVALHDQRYDPGEPDAKFGVRTTQAVWAFQALHGLPKDGVVTPELEAAILARSPQGMLRPELGPTHTEVDLTRQVMMVFRDGAPVLITHVSTGSQIPYCEDTDQGRNCGNAVTPEGTYKFGRRVAGWREAPLGKLYNPVYFNGGIAVHGANSVPGHPASHGCVRIPMSIAEYFPSLVNTGDVITVFRS